MNAQELDDVYTKLGYALTQVGEDKTPLVLARLTLLLMKRVDDAASVSLAIDEAVEGIQAQ